MSPISAIGTRTARHDNKGCVCAPPHVVGVVVVVVVVHFVHFVLLFSGPRYNSLWNNVGSVSTCPPSSHTATGP